MRTFFYASIFGSAVRSKLRLTFEENRTSDLPARSNFIGGVFIYDSNKLVSLYYFKKKNKQQYFSLFLFFAFIIHLKGNTTVYRRNGKILQVRKNTCDILRKILRLTNKVLELGQNQFKGENTKYAYYNFVL